MCVCICPYQYVCTVVMSLQIEHLLTRVKTLQRSLPADKRLPVPPTPKLRPEEVPERYCHAYYDGIHNLWDVHVCVFVRMHPENLASVWYIPDCCTAV